MKKFMLFAGALLLIAVATPRRAVAQPGCWQCSGFLSVDESQISCDLVDAGDAACELEFTQNSWICFTYGGSCHPEPEVLAVTPDGQPIVGLATDRSPTTGALALFRIGCERDLADGQSSGDPRGDSLEQGASGQRANASLSPSELVGPDRKFRP